MRRLLDCLRDFYPKILGAVLLAGALVTLLAAPPKPDFSLANFYVFIVLTLLGGLLVMGLVGPHPEALRLRREARRAGHCAKAAARNVAEQVFRYWPAVTLSRILVTAFLVVLALLLVGLGVLLTCAFPGPWAERVAIALPQWLVGILCLWVPLRQSTMWVRLDGQGIEARGYFRTVRLQWEDVVALVSKEPRILSPFGFLSVGRIYTVYSPHDRLSFVERLPRAAELAAAIARATGMEWKS